MSSSELPSYPRTLHLPGSGTGHSKHSVDVRALWGASLVVEEKLDGAHVAVFFDDDANVQLVSRQTVLERTSSTWASLFQLVDAHLDALYDVLGHRFVLYGEWMQHTHSIFYDQLPQLFIEDDVFDRDTQTYASTAKRRRVLASLPTSFSTHAPVLHVGVFTTVADLVRLVQRPTFQSNDWRDTLSAAQLAFVDDSDLMEGLYVKHEVGDDVLQRCKWVRPSFVAHVQGGVHWKARPSLRNRLTIP